MIYKFDNNFFLIVKMSLITSQSEIADGAIVALGACIVARRLYAAVRNKLELH